LRATVQLLVLIAPQRAYDPVELDQALTCDVLDAAHGPHGHARVLLAGQAGRARLHRDGAELVRDDVVKLAREAGPLRVVRQASRGSRRVTIGRGDLAQSERGRQQRERQSLLPGALGGQQHDRGGGHGGGRQDPRRQPGPGSSPRSQPERADRGSRRGGVRILAESRPDGQHGRRQPGHKQRDAPPPQERHGLGQHQGRVAEHDWRGGAVSRRPPPPGHVRGGPCQQPGGDEPVGYLARDPAAGCLVPRSFHI